MGLFRRRSKETSKEQALAEARRATARLRSEAASLERWRKGKQANPQTSMTTNQRLGSGS